MNNYQISVVTPFHNVDQKYFEDACQSMIHQTIGFENVEWIIVVHNSQPEHMTLLQQRLGQYDNVKLYELNNDRRTPSSPRNYGIQMASAPYIGFLDADDSYKLNCLEEAVKNIRETKSQVLCFRRDHGMEDKTLMGFNEATMWNQLESRIVVEHNRLNDEKMFNDLWGFITAKVVERQFLTDRNISFDEEMLYAEDLMFSLQVLTEAKRICYLPQLIGYHYYINSGSLVQSQEKSAEELITYAKGFTKLFDAVLSKGIDYDFTIIAVCYNMSIFMLYSTKLTVEDRREIKSILQPYIQLCHTLPVNKINTPLEIEMKKSQINHVIMNPEDGVRSFQTYINNGEFLLYNILQDNAGTDFGQYYSFENTRSQISYRNRVPLMSYDDYLPLIRLHTNIAEKNILSADETEVFLRKLSGKVLPATKRHIEPYFMALAKTLKGHNNLWLASSSPVAEDIGELAFVDSLKSMMVKNYFYKYYYAYGKKQATFATPMSMFFSEDDTFNDYAFMCKGIADKDVDQIVSMTTGDVLKAFRVLEERWLEMVAEISLTDKARAEELKGIFAEGFEGIAGRIWPNLKRVMAYGAGKQSEATEQLKRYIKGTALNHGYYMTAESLIAQATGDDEDTFKLITDNDFFEFLPIEKTGGELKSVGELKTKLLSECKTGETYQLVVTNQAGLYRFKTNHHVTFVSNSLEEGPVVTIID